MSKFTDQQYLKTDQYKDAANLNARLEIHKRFSANPYGWYNWVFDTLIKLPAGAKILELGCGPAHMWRDCSNRIPAGWDITLSDLSSGMLDSAWRNLVVTGRNYKFKEIDAQSIPFEDETFDAVIANFMLYHVSDRPKALHEIRRVLKPGGGLIAVTVGDNHMQEMMERLRQVHVSKIWESYANPFTLENGLDQLSSFFPNVTISRYEDHLNVIEIEPIMAYIHSSMRATELSEEELANVQRDLENELKEKGKIFITKDSGLFEATKQLSTLLLSAFACFPNHQSPITQILSANKNLSTSLLVYMRRVATFPCLLVSLLPNSHWQRHSKPRLAWLRLNRQLSVMPVHNNIVRYMQTQACAAARRLRCKERLENARANIFRDAGSIINNLDNHIVILRVCPQNNFSRLPCDCKECRRVAIHSVNRVVHDIRPHLIQLAGIRFDVRQVGRIFPFDVHTFL